MQPVYVMDEKDKAFAGFALVVVAVLVGGWLGWNWLFPSESDRLSKASSAQSAVTRELSNIDSSVKSLELYASRTQPFTSSELTQVGDNLQRAKNLIESARSELYTVHNQASHLQNSKDVSTRLQAAGYAAFATETGPKLDAFAERLSKAESKLGAGLTSK